MNHDHGRLQWQFGPNGATPVVTGMDVAVFEQGKIRALIRFRTMLRATKAKKDGIQWDANSRAER